MTIADTRVVYVEPLVWARREWRGEYHESRHCYRLRDPYATTAVTERLAQAAGWRRCPACGKEGANT